MFDVISGVAKVTLPDNARNFLRTVIENGRLSALPEIAAQFRALKNAQSGSSDAIVYSAFPIDAGALADLSGVLEKRFGRKLNARVVIKPELIGEATKQARVAAEQADAYVGVARLVAGESLAEVVASLEKRFARKLSARVEIEPELIGGIRVVVGDEVLDTSVKARLEQMRVALTA